MSRNVVSGGRPVRARAAATLLGLALVLCGCSTGTTGTTAATTGTAVGSSGVDSPESMSSGGVATTAGSRSAAAESVPTSRFPTGTVRTSTVSTSTVSTTTVSSSTAPSTTPPTTTTTSTPTAPAVTPADLGGDFGLAGLNDPECRSDTPPVVLLQGTLSTVESNFATLVPELRQAGACPYALPFRFGGTVAVRETATAEADFVRRVLAATGATQVDLVGYSQGALVARTALREDGIADRVRVLVLVAGTFHGTTAALLDRVPAAVCAACVDQRAGSELLRSLDAGGELDGGVRYAAVSSRADQVVTPVERQTPAGPANRVSWMLLQDECPTSTTPHESMLADPSVRRWIVDALASGGRPSADTLAC